MLSCVGSRLVRFPAAVHIATSPLLILIIGWQKLAAEFVSVLLRCAALTL